MPLAGLEQDLGEALLCDLLLVGSELGGCGSFPLQVGRFVEVRQESCAHAGLAPPAGWARVVGDHRALAPDDREASSTYVVNRP